MNPPGGPIASLLRELLEEFLQVLDCGLRGLLMILAQSKGFLACHRLWSLLTLGLLAVTILVGVRVLPVGYGKLALAHEARIAGQQALLLGEDRVLLNLRRAAFSLGFTEAATQPGVFSFEYLHEDTLQQCAVTYDVVHVLNFYGVAKLPVRIHGRELRPTLERPAAVDPERELPGVKD